MTDFGIRRYRSVFISDVHLGTKGCQAELLLDFIRHVECDALYLVGDIIDGWKLRGGWYWPQSPQRRGAEDPAHGPQGRERHLCPRQSRRGRAGTTWAPTSAGWSWRGTPSTRPPTASRFLVTARRRVRRSGAARPLAGLCRRLRLSRILIAVNTLMNRVRRRMGFGYWSLSAFLKTRVKNALHFIENFEAAVADEARRRGVDGVICGHIHKAEMRDIDGIALCQRRRLGGKLHGPGGAYGRPAGNPRVGQDPLLVGY
jgi:UDP-2,3-diacylglucosamine pyrophosphatase LpxH